MRVISGSARGRKLKQVPGDSTRPVMDRVKENLFNILADSVVGSRWLDMFAGTGQVGIEALSRGARQTVFIDTVWAAIRTIKQNLETTRLDAGAVVIRQDAFHYLKKFDGEPFDVIYIAPPQYKGIWKEALLFIDPFPHRFLTAAGTIIVQIDPREQEAIPLTGLRLVDERQYGNTGLYFYAVVLDSSH